MKVKLLSTLSFLICQFGFSQTEKPIKGKVLCDNLLLQKIDVINKTSKRATATNEKGEFIIDAKANDSLIFYAKEYHLKKIKLTPELIDQNTLVILMVKKPEELEEVVITHLPSLKWKIDTKWEQEKRGEIAMSKYGGRLKTGIYDGSLDNGANLPGNGGGLFDLFKKKKEKEKKEVIPEVKFPELAKSICDEKFYLETLKLKPDEIGLFLQFCDADPKSKKLTDNHNILSMMDFLSVKNIEFRKLNSYEK